MHAASHHPVLVADIGGTNTRVALAQGAMVRHDTVRRFANSDYADLAAILKAFLHDQGVTNCAGAAVAVAGPVQDGVAEMTNLAWTITPDAVASACGAGPVTILNDLQAQGHALDRIAPRHMRNVITGAADPRDGARLVIGVGTGFNAAPVHRLPGGRLVVPSECGHQTLPVRTQEDLALATHVAAEHGFAGVEDVLSGRGLSRLFGWCAEAGDQLPAISAAEVMQAIGRGGDRIAERTAAIFVRILGCVTGDLALVHLPFQGIYLVGGVARAFAPHLQAHGFRAAFRDKGRFSDFMDQFPVHVVEDDFAALAGCADHLAQVMAEA